MTQKPLTDNVPLDRAWKTGRRIYVRCGYHSRLNRDMRDLGAHWDPQARALWIGSTKAKQVIEVVQAAQERAAATQEIKNRGLWVRIPYEAEQIRARARQVGALYDGAFKQWACPDGATYEEINGMVEGWRQAEQDARRQARAAEAAERKEAAADRRQRVIARSGRTPTGETAAYTEISTAVYNRGAAEAAARPVGEIVQLRDGRRGLITHAQVWFTGGDMASSVCWHDETHDQAHWDWRYELVIVEPNEVERAEDEAEAAEERDTAEIRQTVTAAERAMRVMRDADQDGWTPLPEDQIVGRVEISAGDLQPFSDGTLLLTTDGRAYWRHPGYYDDYRRVEGVIDNPDIVRRLSAIFDSGARTRTHQGQLPTRYRVTTSRSADDHP